MSDSFRPQFPLDPFHAQAHSPYPAFADDPVEKVALVIGEPSPEYLSSLIGLQGWAVLAVCSDPSVYKDLFNPTSKLTILRTSASMTSAVGLANILERAARVSSRSMQLGEDGEFGEFIIQEEFGSSLRGRLSPTQTVPRHSRMSLRPQGSSSSLRKPSAKGIAFDAIIHIMPSLPEAAMLKLGVLVCSLGRTFLDSTSFPDSRSVPGSPTASRPSSMIRSTSRPSSILSSRPSSRLSAFFSSSDSLHAATQNLERGTLHLDRCRTGPGKLIQVLPSTASQQLILRLDAFMVSFLSKTLASLNDRTSSNSSQVDPYLISSSLAASRILKGTVETIPGRAWIGNVEQIDKRERIEPGLENPPSSGNDSGTSESSSGSSGSSEAEASPLPKGDKAKTTSGKRAWMFWTRFKV